MFLISKTNLSLYDFGNIENILRHIRFTKKGILVNIYFSIFTLVLLFDVLIRKIDYMIDVSMFVTI